MSLAAQPYKGLMPYSEEDAKFFFGREAEKEIITANLMASRLTLLYGASGVGKSSVLRAGVSNHIRELTRQNLIERQQPDFVVAVFSSWRDDPVTALPARVEEAVKIAFDNRPIDPVPTSRSLAATLEAWTDRIDGDLLIILDQFEEYFLYHSQEDGEGTFAVEFPRVLNRTDLRMSFLVSIREDSLAKLDRFKGRVPNLFENYLRVEHLDRAAGADAIKKPVEQYNKFLTEGREVSIEPGLVDTVLNQVRAGTVVLGARGRGVVAASDTDKQIETPYLQLVMTRLWEEEVRAESGVLRLETLSRLGGAERIVRTHLDKAIGGLPKEEQQIAAQAFHFLVTPGGTKIAHTISDLSGYANLPQPQLTSVLEKLSGGDIRILRAIQPAPDQPAAPRYEIFHDVLASAILDWRARHTREQDLLNTETQLARERRRVIRKFLLLGGVAALFVALIALLQIVWTNELTTDSRLLAAQSISQLSVDPHASLALALEAGTTKHSDEAEYAIRKSLIESRLRLVLNGHQEQINTASFSTDGKLVVTSSDDQTARIWDSADGKCLFTLAGHKDRVKTAMFDREAQRVLTSSDDHTAALWDVATGQLIKLLNGHKAGLTCAEYSPNGRLAITASRDATARVWDAANGDSVVELRGHGGAVNTAAFSIDSLYVLTASSDNTARVWESHTGKQLAVLKHNAQVTMAAFSPDGRFAVTTSQDSVARIWNAVNWNELATLKGHSRPITAAAFDLSGRVLTASWDTSARLWEPKRQIGQLNEHKDTLRSAQFSPDFRFIVTASDDGTAVVSDAGDLQPIVVLKGHSGPINNASFSSDGRLVVTASGDKTARIWEPSTERSPTEIAGNASDACNTMVSPDRKYTATTQTDGGVKVIESASGTEVYLNGHTERVKNAAFDRSSSLIVTASLDGSARVWATSTGTQVAVLGRNKYGVTSAAFSPFSDYVVTCSTEDNNGARVWNTKTQQQVAHLQGHSKYVNDATFNPDGDLIALASDDRSVTVWEWQKDSNNPRARLLGHTSVVQSVVFSPDGKFLVTSSRDSTVRLWDTANWQSLALIHTQIPRLTRAAFSPDGRFIVAAGKDKPELIRVYECEACGQFEDLLKLAQDRLRLIKLPVTANH